MTQQYLNVCWERDKLKFHPWCHKTFLHDRLCCIAYAHPQARSYPGGREGFDPPPLQNVFPTCKKRNKMNIKNYSFLKFDRLLDMDCLLTADSFSLFLMSWRHQRLWLVRVVFVARDVILPVLRRRKNYTAGFEAGPRRGYDTGLSLPAKKKKHM